MLNLNTCAVAFRIGLPAIGISAHAANKVAGNRCIEYITLKNPKLQFVNVHPFYAQESYSCSHIIRNNN